MEGIQEILNQQRRFFQEGKTLPFKARREALTRLEAAVRRHQNEICDALKQDLHKSDIEAFMTEIGLVLGEIRKLRTHLERYGKTCVAPGSLPQFPSYAMRKKEPYGVVLIMAPWNYPFLLCLQPFAGALAAGNCAVIKPSAYAPATAMIVEQIVREALPEGLAAVIRGGRKANQELLEQRFDYIFFTGGVTVGKLVMEKAAAHLTPVTLELGGKSPCIVEKSARLNLAAKRIVFGKYLNAGQTCVAPDYILVDDSVKEEFCFYLKRWIQRLYGEDPLENPDYPRMINRRHFCRVRRLLLGEKVWIGGRSRMETLQIEPTVVLTDEASPLMQEEIFGPVLPVLSYRNLKEAEQLIREREKPLALYLFTENRKVTRRVLNHISFGGGCVNDTVLHLTSGYLPFGGVGGSGMGRYHGKYSFDTFSHEKGVVFASSRLDLPLRYPPYTKSKRKLIRSFLG
ncbi:aldehyde dehydrogenase [Hominifimenecus sp. rT4P-3]|uniref:aldehyde dehydrogenase n=1 Tax=Hominifimenecus sp. rT4P-3 TaxID=3242979 RepID=UPI003DA23CB1